MFRIPAAYQMDMDFDTARSVMGGNILEKMENMQKNAFGIITQLSTAASIFKEQPWEEMDKESREYALN